MTLIQEQIKSTWPAFGILTARSNTMKAIYWVMAVWTFVGTSRGVVGQDIRVSSPLVGVSDSYYERHGVNWGFSFGGPSSQVFGSFNQGSAGSAIPPFGGYDPNADATFGFGSFNDNGSGFSLGLRMGKGSTRTMTSNSPSVVVPNGGVGSIFDGSFRPFVTSIVPVIGNPGDIVEPYIPPYQPPMSGGKGWSEILSAPFESEPRPANQTGSVNFRNENSSAQRGDLSVSEIQRQRAEQIDAHQQEIDGWIDQVAEYEQAGKYSRARTLLRRAIKQTEGKQRYNLQLKLESILDK